MQHGKPPPSDPQFMKRLHDALQKNGQMGDGDQIAVFAPPDCHGRIAVRTYHPSQAFDE